MTLLRRTCLVLIALLWPVFTAKAWGAAIQLPLTIPVPLLRTLIAQHAYPLAGEKASILPDSRRCSQIILSDLRLTEKDEYLELQTKVHLTWGAPVLDDCLTPFAWEGSIVLRQRPQIDARWQLSFITFDSALFDPNHKPVQAIGLLWDLIKEHVHGYLNAIRINLAPPVGTIRSCLLPMFADEYQPEAQRFFASMRPGSAVVQPGGLTVPILAEMELSRQTREVDSAPLADRERYAHLLELSQNWDEYLVLQLKQFTDMPIDEADRRALLDTLLTARHAFADVIAQDALSDSFIREQFLWGWHQLAPVFRRHLRVDPATNPLGYLAFFTAHDALRILDQLGPSVGIVISAEGFRRLAELISTEPFDLNKHPNETDQRLREALGLEPLPDPPLPADKPIPVPGADPGDPTSRQTPWQWKPILRFLLPAHAWASDLSQVSRDELARWTAELTPAGILLPNVHAVLGQAAATHHGKLDSPAVSLDWFNRLILASAWQESCFRQFHLNNKSITYLLSSNRTSVGVMQVNEKIWRGVYNSRQLRWNIEYNSQAGCEIMALYFREYLARKKDFTELVSIDNQRLLAAWLYALYNGGPGQTKPFGIRARNGRLFRAEELFLDKYDAINSQEWSERIRCLP